MTNAICCAATMLMSFTLGTGALARAITSQEKISAFHPEDFAFDLGGPEPTELVAGRQVRAVNLAQLPALEGQGISMALVNLDPCAINLPHIHPRASEMLYVIEGDNLRVAFVEENGGDGAVVNDLYQGDVALFPQGLIHYQQNLDCYPATFVAALNSEDPGAVTITTHFFELPTEAIEATLNIVAPEIKTLLEALPEAPALAQAECARRCGLSSDSMGKNDTEEEEDEENAFSYSYDYHEAY